tara:strand:- start:376 stop:489 length:114 start_codon:yes stop_codon:yes gene_type:complete
MDNNTIRVSQGGDERGNGRGSVSIDSADRREAAPSRV